jgi:hypothetical protein
MEGILSRLKQNGATAEDIRIAIDLFHKKRRGERGNPRELTIEPFYTPFTNKPLFL